MKEGSERCSGPGFEDGGREEQAKECRWPLKVSKGTETESLLVSPGRSAALLTLILAQ